MKRQIAFFTATALCALSTTAHAASFLDVSRGSYKQTGIFGTGGSGLPNGNILTGYYGGETFNSFVVFDLATFAGSATSATLNFNLPVAFSLGSNPFSFAIFDYSGSISALQTGGAGVSGFHDLGGGTQLGGLVVTAPANNFSVVLNGAGLAALNSSAGQKIAFGGTLLGGPFASDNAIFGNSAGGPLVELSITTDAGAVPEPATWAMMLLGFAVIGGAMRARKRPQVRVRFAF